jgi:hypothetical protein
MTLVLTFEPGRIFCHIDIDPLFVVVKEDTEGWFGHFGGLSRIDSAPIIYPIFFELKFFNVKISEFSVS